MQDVREIIKEKGRWEGERQGLKKCRQEGEREGLKKGRQEVVLNMLKKKLDISIISEMTSSSEKEIKKLKKHSPFCEK